MQLTGSVQAWEQCKVADADRCPIEHMGYTQETRQSLCQSVMSMPVMESFVGLLTDALTTEAPAHMRHAPGGV